MDFAQPQVMVIAFAAIYFIILMSEEATAPQSEGRDIARRRFWRSTHILLDLHEQHRAATIMLATTAFQKVTSFDEASVHITNLLRRKKLVLHLKNQAICNLRSIEMYRTHCT